MSSPIIIADSSPLIALAIIGQLELLPSLYQRILVPPTVWYEVTVGGQSLPGAQAVSQLTWVEIQAPEPQRVGPLSILVDHGEAEAIALAQSVEDSSILLDDAQARRVAERLGIRRIGTLVERFVSSSQVKPLADGKVEADRRVFQIPEDAGSTRPGPDVADVGCG